MAKPDNIDHFNSVVLHTLDLLYAAFPVPIELKVPEIAELASPGSVPEDLPFDALEPTFEAIRFLAKEGFLTYAEFYLDGTAFLHVQLTMKGLTVLGQAPDSLEQSESLIQRMRGVLASGAKGVASEATKLLVSQAFAAAIKAFPVAAVVLGKA